jgi:hypothetical protein
MATFVRFLKVVGRIVLDKLVGPVNAGELISIISEWRANPGQAAEEIAAAKQAVADPTMLADVVPETTTEQERETVALILTQALPNVSLELLGVQGGKSNDSPDEVARHFIADALPTPKANTYLLWLQPPHILPGQSPGYCHFSYQYNEKQGQLSYRVRDFRNGKLYWGVTRPTKEANLELVPWGDDFTALQLWQGARARVPPPPDYPRKDEFEKWKVILEEMTRIHPPKT